MVFQTAWGSKHLLHPDHIEPATLLEADLLEVGDLFEAELGVESEAARLIGVDPAEHGVVTDFLRQPEQFRQDKTADSPALPLVMQVDGVLNTVLVGRA